MAAAAGQHPDQQAHHQGNDADGPARMPAAEHYAEAVGRAGPGQPGPGVSRPQCPH